MITYLFQPFSTIYIAEITLKHSNKPPPSSCKHTFFSIVHPLNHYKPSVLHDNTTNKKKQKKSCPYCKKKSDNRKFHHHDLEQDFIFFSCTSIFSDSSSGGFSYDTDSLYCTKSRASSGFIPLRPKPVRTRRVIQIRKRETKESRFQLLSSNFRNQTRHKKS
ncbi:unnamed protein product [Vicia faba]|uniref:Uncharacterized protein n=1 Tax=Vicia faba TaxID=3906 RepID=A0AAV1BAG5_VICFA|nr:unnamed protein product [Vicia faba]